MAIIETKRIRLVPQQTIIQTDTETNEVIEIVNPTVITELQVLEPIEQITVINEYAIAQGFEAKTPSSEGTKGDVSYNNGYYYICYDTDSWARIPVQIANFTPKPIVYNEIPTGDINGTNKIFTTINNFKTTTTQVFLNGLRMRLGASYDYQEIGNTQIEFNTAPRTNSQLLLDYSII